MKRHLKQSLWLSQRWTKAATTPSLFKADSQLTRVEHR